MVRLLWSTHPYIRLRREFVYLAVVLDAYSRRCIGWALSRHIDTELALAALRMALANRTVQPGLVHHSDRGVQYASADYVALLKEHQIQISMSRTGNPYDNAKAERFMRTLKYEEIVCYERDRWNTKRERCFTKDEGRPLGVGLQEQASNRHKLRRLRVFVVSVEGKGGGRLHQGRVKETNESEPLMTCRNVFKRRRNRDLDFCPAIKVEGNLLIAQPASGMKAA